MRTYAIICYVVAAVAEAGGLGFVLLSLRENRRQLDQWKRQNLSPGDGTTFGQLDLLETLIPVLLDAGRWRPRIAAGLITLGIIAGTLGNFTGLPS